MFQCEGQCRVPEAHGWSVGKLGDWTGISSHGDWDSTRTSVAPGVGDTASTGSAAPLPSSPGWSFCCLNQSLDGPGRWVLLLLTRNDRGMADWWLREVEILQNQPAGVWNVSSNAIRCQTPAGAYSVTMSKLEVSSTSTAQHLQNQSLLHFYLTAVVLRRLPLNRLFHVGEQQVTKIKSEFTKF